MGEKAKESSPSRKMSVCKGLEVGTESWRKAKERSSLLLEKRVGGENRER